MSWLSELVRGIMAKVKQPAEPVVPAPAPKPAAPPKTSPPGLACERLAIRPDVNVDAWEAVIRCGQDGKFLLRVRDGDAVLNFGVAEFRALLALAKAAMTPPTPAPPTVPPADPDAE